MYTMTNQQRAALRKAVGAADPTAKNVSQWVNAELIARAQALGLDIPAIISAVQHAAAQAFALAQETNDMTDDSEPETETVVEAQAIAQGEPTMSPEALAERDAINQAWDDMSPKAFRAMLDDLIVRAHKPAEIRTVTETVIEYQSAPAGSVAPVIARQAKRTGTITLGKLFALPASHKLSPVTTDLWSGGMNVPDVAHDHVWPEDIDAFASASLVRNRPSYFVGPKGVGKTTTIEQIAARTGRPFVVISCSEETELPALCGTLVPHNGSVTFKFGALTAAMQMHGAIVLIDEGDTLRQGVAVGLNGILENRAYTVPETGERIVCAPGVILIMAGNTNGRGDVSGRYGGTQEQNSALMSRFRAIVAVSYLRPAAEVKLLIGRTSCPPALAKLLVGAANVTREAVSGGTLSDGMSFRALEAWAGLLVDGIEPETAARCALLNGASVEEREVLLQILMTHAGEGLVREALGTTPVGRGAADFSNV